MMQDSEATTADGSLDASEMRLMLAVLLNAIAQLGSRGARHVAEAEEWILGGGGADLPFSFRNVCEALGIESRPLARGLLAWRARKPNATPRGPLRAADTLPPDVAPFRERARRPTTRPARSAATAGT